MFTKSQKEDRSSAGKQIWAENVRAIATCAVIFLHVAAPAVEQFGKIDGWNWWVANFFDALTRFSVPVFLMLSGAFLLGKEYNLQEYFRRRFHRVVIPFLFWSFMYSSFRMAIHLYQGGSVSWKEALTKIISDLWQGASYHFWYIYLILGIYLLIPFLNRQISKISGRKLERIIIIWFIILLASFIPLKIYGPIADSYFLLLYNFPAYLGYLLLGFYLTSPKAAPLEKNTGLVYALLFLGFSFTFFGSGWFTNSETPFYELFYGFLSPNVVAFSTGVFLLLKNMDQSNPLLSTISKHSYGIYLVHVMILIILDDLFPSPSFPLLITIPLFSLLCILLSWGLIHFFRRLPILKKITG